MKQLLTILCLVLLSSYSYSQEVIPEVETVIREGLVHHRSPTEPFTGIVETFHRRGKGRIKYRETYKDGKLEGLWEKFYENGQLRSRQNYKNGKLDGLSEWFYTNGRGSRRCYKDDEKVDMSYCED